MEAKRLTPAAFGRVFGGMLLVLAIGGICLDATPVSAQPPGFGGDDDGDSRRGSRGRRGGWFGRDMNPEDMQRMRDAFRQRMERAAGNSDSNTERGGSEDRDSGRGENDRSRDRSDEPQQRRTPGVERPTTPPRVPDPRELDVQLDERGRVPPFSFIGQPWPDVLQWLAKLENYSLDWQEMPADYLNLVTEESLTFEEVRDLINRHLLTRGFTTLIEKEVLSVFRINDVEPSLVPRLTEDDLYDMRPYELAKVSFELPPGMEPDRAAEDVKKILSPAARVFPLTSTRRLLVLDVVANLRNVSALFNEERGVAALPKEFPLRYARGQKVIETLYVLLGINPEQRPQQLDMRVARQRWQAIEEIAESGGDVRGMMEGPKVYLAYNPQRNSVLANAPPEQMRVIAQTIRAMDVPPGGLESIDGSMNPAGGYASGDLSERYLKNYQLITADPDRMLVTLQEVGGLSPWTELRADAASKLLFVRATESDHQKVARLIDELDGAGRSFHVIPLRKLPADSVAVTIQQMLVRSTTSPQEQQEQANRRDRRGRGRGGRPNIWAMFQQQNQEYDPTEGFRVSADIEANRLLLWANEQELKEVTNLLAQLGETGGTDRRDGFRVIDIDQQSVDRLLEQLRRSWAGENELIIDGPVQDSSDGAEGRGSTRRNPPRGERSSRSSTRPADPAAESKTSEDLSAGVARKPHFVLVQNTQVLEDAAEQVEDAPDPVDATPTEAPVAEPASPADDGINEPVPQENADEPAPDADESSAPPIKITTTPDGRLIVSSADPEAVARIEELIRMLGPRRSPFEVFEIEHVSASSVWMQLTEYFQEELGLTSDGFGFGQRSSSSTMQGLADRRGLRILYDSDNNVILVANATASQLEEIEDLIEVFDQPRNVAGMKTRRTAIIPLKYSKAAVVATAIKDVYRDLLSTRDKEFQSNNGRGSGGSIRPIAEDTVIRFGDAAGQTRATTSDPLSIGFDGALSVGVDEVSNAVVISADQALFAPVVAMVRELDEQAHTDTQIVVQRVGESINPAALQVALSSILGSATTAPTDQAAQNAGRNNGRNRDGGGGFDRGQFFRQFGGGQSGGGQQFDRGNQRGGQRGNFQRGQGGRGQQGAGGQRGGGNQGGRGGGGRGGGGGGGRGR